MRTADIVVDVAYRYINRPVLVLTCGNRNGCFIASENDGNKHRPMCIWVFGNKILVNIVRQM